MSKLQIFFIIISLLLLFILRFYFYYRTLPQYKQGDQLSFAAKLEEEPQIVSYTQQFGLQLKGGQKVKVIAPLRPGYSINDHLKVAGELKIMLLKNGYRYLSLGFPKIEKLENADNLLTSSAEFIKTRAQNLFDKTLPPVSSSLMSGIVFGGKHEMPDGFMQSLKNTGVMHIIAASGMNVTFTAGALMYFFGSIFKRRTAIVICIFGIIYYVFLAGFEPSIIRASIMAVFGFSAGLLGRQNFAVFTIFVTGYLMLLFDPSLLTNIGFQLSFLSTLGILLLKPVLPFSRKLLLSDDLGTTLSAQIMTLPLMLSVFGQYSLISVPVNLLVLWTVAPLMTLGALGISAGMIFEPLGKIFLYLSLPLLLYFEKTVGYFGSLSWKFQIESFPWELTAGYYLMLFSVLFLIKKRKKNL